MKIPIFKPSRLFVNGVRERCLVAKLKASQIPSLGRLHMRATGDEPEFSVFLRGPKPSKASAWQVAILKRLFAEEELLKAIKQGMNDYEKSGGFEDATTRRHIKANGILAYLRLTDIIIDEFKQEILLCLSAELEDLGEHAIVIHGGGSDWKFDNDNYLSNYVNEFGVEPVKQACGQNAFSTDPSLLYGKWVVDEEATVALMLKRGVVRKQIQPELTNLRGLGYVFAKGKFHATGKFGERKSQYVGCKLKGSRLEVNLNNPEIPDSEETWDLRFVDGKLIGDWVMKRS